ncbi:substrate-binding domain-containing protein [Ancylothrix sp. C2]|uniref:substrate-binding domain-containing protein n=1 Tax=Ancylothrix sp. D3o TaxID=2953691 RepID=UPI0021BAEFCD|nr:substrate-binding domain-containing protein [Ancylothrix sp. D3o]MCT7952087.1 substrate-binding domain-containing protein [Ancylothrix sp. D3o]
MAKKSGPPPIVYILIFLLLAAGGYWFFVMKQPQQETAGTQTQTNQTQTNQNQTNNTSVPQQTGDSVFKLPAFVPAGTTVSIDGSTSMVAINRSLKVGFQKQFPSTIVYTIANGTEKGLEALKSGNVDIAAISRPLTPQEKNQGLVAVPIALDAIAIVVGINNPWKQGLTSGQVEDIFEGDIKDWSKVGGQPSTIRVINRPAISGTHQTFKELVLGGGSFGSSPNITTLSQDATTPLLQALKNDGIGYATYTQVAQQQTVRVVPVNNLTPDNPAYPYQRTLFYVYKNPASPQVQAFLGYVTSPQGQQAMSGGN